MLEGAKQGARHATLGRGRAGEEEEESRHWKRKAGRVGPPPPKATWKRIYGRAWERQEVVMEYLLGKENPPKTLQNPAD